MLKKITIIHLYLLVVLVESLSLSLSLKKKRIHRRTNERDGQTFGHNASSIATRYLIVYYFAVLGDWLQGPYIYVILSQYGYESRDVKIFIVTGYVSSLILGSFVSAFADSVGKKRMTMVFFLIYALSCAFIHVNHYVFLYISRILSGISTSLLYSVFEAWLSATLEGKSKSIKSIFSIASFGSSILAILAGLLAQVFVNIHPEMEVLSPTYPIYGFGVVSSFSLSAFFLICGYVAAGQLWTENITKNDDGDNDKNKRNTKNIISDSVCLVYRDMSIFLLGVTSAAFEGAMFTWVAVWSQTLLHFTDDSHESFGQVFSILMLSCMIGSITFSVVVMLWKFELQHSLFVVIVVASIAQWNASKCSSYDEALVTFVVYEICVGFYWPVCVCVCVPLLLLLQQKYSINN